jgi:hypothetical protein
MKIVAQKVYDEIHNFFVKEQFMSNQDTEIQLRKKPDNRSSYGELSHKSSNTDDQTLMISMPDTETLKIKSNELRNLLLYLRSSTQLSKNDESLDPWVGKSLKNLEILT